MDTGSRGIFGTGKTLSRRVLRWVFCGLSVLILIPAGSTDPAALHAIAACFFIVAFLAVIAGVDNQRIRSAYWLALAVALVLGLWIILQASSLPGSPAINTIWAEAARNYGAMTPSISVSPGDTLEGLIAALLPFAVFMTVLMLFKTDEDALALLRAIVISGVAICILGLIQFLFFPDTLLLDAKQFYLGTLTAVFVNKNTAATYISMIAIFSAGLGFHTLQNAGLRSLGGFLINAPNHTRRADGIASLGYGMATVIALVALMLTQSRAGISAGLMGLFVTLAILTYSGGVRRASSSRNGFSVRRTPFWIKAGRMLLVLLAILLIGLLFAGPAILRAGARGASDLRFCFFPSLVEMTGDHWLVGSGFGTFRDVFPAYRNPACGMDGVLLLAHNVYLEGWISLGLPFVAVAAVVVIALFYYLIDGIRSRRQYRWMPAAGLGVLLLQLAHNSVDFSIQIPGVAAVFAALMGAAVVVSRGRLPKTHARTGDARAAARTGQDAQAPTS